MSENNKTILCIAFAISFVINSVIYTWSHNRRSADDLVKIHANDKTSLEKRFDDCIFNTSAENIDSCKKIKELTK